MNRLSRCFETLKKRDSKALVTFITAGDPDLTTTEEMILLLEESGSDIIELGMPFSDPMADGPTIQLSSERALSAGTNLDKILTSVQKVRTTSQIPIILMGYLNPIHAYGYERFARDAAHAGVDGLLLVDMPPEESKELLGYANHFGLNIIFLLTPTSDADRMATVAKIGQGFVYYVTVAGVTGARQNVSTSLEKELVVIRDRIKIPVVAGFGISTPEQAASVASLADGVVVGSAIVKLFEKYSGAELRAEVHAFISALKKAIS